MNKKTLIQVILIIFLIILIYLVFKNYYISSEPINELKKKDNTVLENESEKSDKNLIKDINYTANNTRGDVYLLVADYGEIYLDNPELMFLTKVSGKITLYDGESITVVSDFANFNTKNFETTFINNVIVKRGKEKITSDELYLILEKDKKDQNSDKNDENLIRLSRNVFYEKPGYKLSADILEIDLITKNINIYMIDKNKKIYATSEIK